MMKKTLTLVSLLALTGCMAPNYTRLIPENKDAHIEVVAPLYGHIIIDTRVQGSTNQLAPLPTPGVGGVPVTK